MASLTTAGGTGRSEHDAAWALAERATEEINRHVRIGTAVWLGPRVEHRWPDRWLAWVEREPPLEGTPPNIHVVGETEAQALRGLGWALTEHPPE